MGFFHNQYISSVRRFWSITIGSTLRTGWWRSRSAWMNKSCPALRKLLYSKSFKQFMCKKKSHQILNKRVNRNRIFIYLITISVSFVVLYYRQHFENLQGSAMINSKYGNLDFPWLHQEENEVQEYVILKWWSIIVHVATCITLCVLKKWGFSSYTNM